jgi:hypothetical protein
MEKNLRKTENNIEKNENLLEETEIFTQLSDQTYINTILELQDLKYRSGKNPVAIPNAKIPLDDCLAASHIG